MNVDEPGTTVVLQALMVVPADSPSPTFSLKQEARQAGALQGAGYHVFWGNYIDMVLDYEDLDLHCEMQP